MHSNFSPLDVLRCTKNHPIRIGDAILPAWVSHELHCVPLPLLEECVSLGYLEKIDHSNDRIPCCPSYNITPKGCHLLNRSR